jgi:RimJ/RimL family protein N-acetyltransferase
MRARLEEMAESDDPQFYTVLDGDGQPLGTASYLRINPEAASIEVGWISFSPRLQRTIMSTEAMALMMTRAFDELEYRRYEWKCDALNAPSRAAAERLGFTYEGTHRQATVVKGRNRDTAWFSILDQEWPRIKRGLTAWLDPGNFDEKGRQMTPLSDLFRR